MLRADWIAPVGLKIGQLPSSLNAWRAILRRKRQGEVSGRRAATHGGAGNGAGKRTRTSDPRITNALLYQLSYPGARQAESRAFYIFLRSLMTRSMPATSVPGGGGGRRLNATAGTGTSIRAPLSRS